MNIIKIIFSKYIGLGIILSFTILMGDILSNAFLPFYPIFSSLSLIFYTCIFTIKTYYDNRYDNTKISIRDIKRTNRLRTFLHILVIILTTTDTIFVLQYAPIQLHVAGYLILKYIIMWLVAAVEVK